MFLLFRSRAQDELFCTVVQSTKFLHRMTSITSCSASTLARLQQHVKDNGVMSLANAQYASKTFGALYDWVLCMLEVSSGRAIIHYASSPEMIRTLATCSGEGGLKVDICDEVCMRPYNPLLYCMMIYCVVY